MQNYAEKYAAQANMALDGIIDARVRLASIALDARLGISAVEGVFKGRFRFVGPAFDAAQLMAGFISFGATGDYTALGEAAMGVAMSGALGSIVGGTFALFGAPIGVVALMAGVAAGVGSLWGQGAYQWMIGTLNKISPDVNEFFRLARSWLTRDPLVLDLDGDGIEAIGANSRVLFDYDGDGVRNGTGWLSSDDGLLVRDRNGNGTIENGSELFGVDYVKSNGSKAVDGFDALRDLDSNLDGLFDTKDSLFGNVRIWRDLNQDGVSQAVEIFTLQTLGITGIGLRPKMQAVNLNNGNQQTASDSFFRADGSSGTAANLAFADNPFYRIFPDKLDTGAVAALPDLEGSGGIRDLREAASQSSQLATIVENYASLATRSAQLAELDNLIGSWASSSSMATSIELAKANNLKLIFLAPGESKKDYETASLWNGDIYGDSSAEAKRLAELETQRRSLTSIIILLERFNGMTFVDVSADSVISGGGSVYMAEATPGNSGGGGGIVGPFPVYVPLSANIAEFLRKSYSSLKESVYGGLIVQTRLAAYLSDLKVSSTGDGFLFDFQGLDLRLDARKQVDKASALSDLIELSRYYGSKLNAMGWSGTDKLVTWVNEAAGDPALQMVFSELNVKFGSGSVSGSDNADVLLGGSGRDALSGGIGSDFLYGGAGVDTLRSGAGDDYLDGGVGDDIINGGDGSDIYRFNRASGNDTISEGYDATVNTDTVLLDAGINPADVSVRRDGTGDDLLLSIAGATNKLRIESYFRQDGASPYAVEQIKFADGTIWDVAIVKAKALAGTAGNDTLVGYASADVLNGGAGDDRLDGRGGSDVYLFGRASGNDTISEGYDATVNTDTVLLDAGINPADVSVRRDGTGDDLLLSIAGATNKLRIESYFRQDGASPNAVEQIKFADGTIWDVATVKAKALAGTAGNDTLVGYASADVLNGGAGDDRLDGRGGSDVYLFGRASGNDTISEGYDATVNTDTVLLDAGINPADVSVRRDGTGDDLLLSIAGATNKLRIESYFRQDGASPNAVEQIKFADGTIWDVATVKAKALAGTAGNDTLVGYASADVLNGGAGDDRLDGRGGSDVYLFGRASGNDTISEGYDATVNTDTVLLDAGINPADVSVRRDGTGDDLLLSIAGATNKLRIEGYFRQDGASPNAVEQIKFANGTIWDVATVKAKALAGTAGYDTLVGYASADVLNGGAGDDRLDGRGGSDVYLFGRASGNDTISEGYDATVNTDTVLLDAGINPADVSVRRDGTRDDLLLSIAGATNKLRIEGYFRQDGASPYAVEQIKFADGTIWDVAIVKAKALAGTAGNDTLVGYASADVLNGGAGDDRLDGRGGSDVYLFGRASGNDTISEGYDATVNTDTVLLDAGINPADVSVRRDGTGDDLLLSIAGATNKLRIESYFRQDGASPYAVEQIKFANGTIWDVATVKAKALAGTAGNDTLVGYASADVLNGGAGDDRLDGRGGSDVYLFGRASGNDTISEGYDATVNTDTVLLDAGINPADVSVRRDGTGDDLLLSIAGATNKLRIEGYFRQDGASPYAVEQIKFADGTIWDVMAVKAKVLSSTGASSNIPVGFASTDEDNVGAYVRKQDLNFSRMADALIDTVFGRGAALNLQERYVGDGYCFEKPPFPAGSATDSQAESLVSAMAAFAPAGDSTIFVGVGDPHTWRPQYVVLGIATHPTV